MKKVLKFSPICAAVIAIISFILMMATAALHAETDVLGSTVSSDIAGTTAIFGKTTSTAFGDVVTKLSWAGLLAWILVIVAIVILLAGFILPLLKVHALDKFVGVFNLVAVVALVLAGVFMFIIVPTFAAANGWENANGWSIGAGWVIGGILAIVAGVVAILPTAMDFIGEKK